MADTTTIVPGPLYVWMDPVYESTAARCTKSKGVGKYGAWYSMLLPTCCAPRIFFLLLVYYTFCVATFLFLFCTGFFVCVGWRAPAGKSRDPLDYFLFFMFLR